MKRLFIIFIFASILVGCAQATPPPATDTPISPPTEATAEAYTVDIDPADFVEVIDNLYYPRFPGSKYVYEGLTADGLERIEIEILDETREVMGIQATVMRDIVYLEGELIEDTLDWFAQDKEGNVWYLGEDVKNYENGKFVDNNGSWEAGVEGALPGIIMFADPAAHLGETYRQEYYKGKAEDMADLLSVSESVTIPYGSFANVVQTLDYTPLEPDAQEHKFYAEGIGSIKTVDLTTGEEFILVEFIPAAEEGGMIDEAPVPGCGTDSGVGCAPDSDRVDLAEPSFSDPTSVTNPLFPISQLHSAILLGNVNGQLLRVETTLLPETKTIDWNGQPVETLVSQYVAYLDGRIEEVALDWYAQANDGAVWYFGEDVFNYADGVVADTEGTWLTGRDGPAAMIMPADPQLGDVFRPENSPGFVFEEVTVTSIGFTVDGPHGLVDGALVTEELHMNGSLEDKFFAPGYGEFSTGSGGNLEALALAVPIDALSGPLPTELETLFSGAIDIFDAAEAEAWDAAAASLEAMTAAWATYQADSDVPELLKAQMGRALAALAGDPLVPAVIARNPVGARKAAIDVAQASLDFQLQYRPVPEIDLARFDLWSRQLLVDAADQEPGDVTGDVATLEWIWDRIAHTLDSYAVNDIEALLGDLRDAADDEDLAAAAAAGTQLRDLLATLKPTTGLNHVVIISIDGLRPDALSLAEAPTLDNLIATGAYSPEAQTLSLSITLPSHASMLTGMPPEKHGILWGVPYIGWPGMQGPTLFNVAHEAGLSTAMVFGKERLNYLVLPNSVDKIFGTDAHDSKIRDKTLRFIREGLPNVLFIHFPDVDRVGHAYGWMSENQLYAITYVDGLIGEIVAALENQGYLDNTLLIITSDHGGHGFAHGDDSPLDRTIPWLAVGPGVPSGLRLTRPINTVDTAATTLYALKLPIPESCEGQPILEIFQ